MDPRPEAYLFKENAQRRRLRRKNKLKNGTSIKKENTISLKLVLTILPTSFTGKKPPDEIIVIAILKESNVLRLISFNDKNKNSVKKT